jgi:hypothetical protein
MNFKLSNVTILTLKPLVGFIVLIFSFAMDFNMLVFPALSKPNIKTFASIAFFFIFVCEIKLSLINKKIYYD